MSRNTIDLLFADGEYTFALPLPRIDELQRKTGVGIGALFNRLLKGCIDVGEKVYLDPNQAEFFAADIVETLRQGLIGGGRGVVGGSEVQVTPTVANRLIDSYVLDRPLADSWSLAAAVLGACVSGYEPPKKDVPASERAAESPETEASTTA